jgi:arylsulfatase A-like enzyme
MDLYPTILQLAGLDIDPNQHQDGLSLLPILNREGPIRRDILFWHFPHYHGSTWTPGSAIRKGKWKLIEFYHWDKVELYDIDADLGERDDLSERMPEKTQELTDLLHSIQEETGAQLPTENPGFTKEETID